MKRASLFMSVLCAVAILMGCGPEQNAKSLVKDFLAQNLIEGDFSSMSFEHLDSTRNINVDIISRLRAISGKKDVFKSPVVYTVAKEKDPLQLKYIQVRYKVKDKELKQTFYFDNAVTRVVCFKDDYE